MAHIPRKFVDNQQSLGSAIAEEAIKRSCSPVERFAIRQEKAKPVFDYLETWLHAKLQKT